MPKYHQIGSVVCFAASVALGGYAAVGAGGSRGGAGLSAEGGGVIDLGTIGQGEQREVEFRLANDSDAAIYFRPVMTSCSCTRATLGSSGLKSGETTWLKATFRAGSSRGAIASHIGVPWGRTETGPAESANLQIVAFVKPDYAVRPPRLDLAGADAAIHEIVVAPEARESIRVTGVSCDRTWVDVLGYEPSSGGAWVVRLRVVAERWRREPGAGLATVVIRTDSEAEPAHGIPIAIN